MTAVCGDLQAGRRPAGSVGQLGGFEGGHDAGHRRACDVVRAGGRPGRLKDGPTSPDQISMSRVGVPELQRLVRRQLAGDPEQALVRLLLLACEQLGLRAAVVGHVTADVHHIELAVRGGHGRAPELEGPRPASESFCARVQPEASLVLRDIAEPPPPESSSTHGGGRIRCYIGTALRDDDCSIVGVLGLFDHAPHARLDPRDVDVLEGLAQVVGERYVQWKAAGGPARAQAVTAPSERPAPGAELARDLAGLTRPLLDALHELSGIASTYLTQVRAHEDEQQLLLAHNAGADLVMPEGATIPWEQSMCWLALNEGSPAVSDLSSRWPQVQVAAALGIETHVSVPVLLSDGSLFGTLCASDKVAHQDVKAHLPTLMLFARLIAAEVQRTAAVARERAHAEEAQRVAATDELTGCASRRTVRPWLLSALELSGPDEATVVAFLDVDSFKVVNDQQGHATGDTVLRELAARLRAASRPGDLVARLGGDEFVVAARVARHGVYEFEQRLREAGRFRLITTDGVLPVRCSVGFASSDYATTPTELLELSDAAMYVDKGTRRTSA